MKFLFNVKVTVTVRLIKDLNERAARFNVIIAGSYCLRYNPYATFQERVRRGIVIGLHKGYSLRSIAKLLNVPEHDVESHIRYMREAEFIVEKEGRIIPAFFIALREDVRRAKKAARRLGVEIGEVYKARWDVVMETYRKLSASSRFDFDRVGFVLIGAYSLDVGMLKKFEEEGKIMPRAPARKCGQYYMWGVEGGLESLGRYGMHYDELGEYGFASFGGRKRGEECPRPTPCLNL
ncbi:MAG: hypothetical protein P3X22_005360 [Thermoprotei archaeon]|nr:hypothetical protein [Thermoprotei archaeon]